MCTELSKKSITMFFQHGLFPFSHKTDGTILGVYYTEQKLQVVSPDLCFKGFCMTFPAGVEHTTLNFIKL